MTETAKEIGTGLLGILLFIAVIGGFALVLVFGSTVAFKVDPILNVLVAIAFFINILLIPLLIFRRTRAWYALLLLISSYVYGVSLWVLGFLITYVLWGLGAVILGVFVLGVGVVPFAFLASLFHANWPYFFNLLFLLVLFIIARIGGAVLLAYTEENEAREKDELEAHHTTHDHEKPEHSPATEKRRVQVDGVGGFTEGVGWLILGVGVFAPFTTSYIGPASYGYWAIYAVIGSYFLYTGRYIRGDASRHRSGILLLNGFLLLLLAPGIFTFIVSIISFVNVGRARTLQKELATKHTKPLGRRSTKQIVVFIILIVLGLVMAGLKSTNDTNPSISQQSSTYTATKHNFTINFPGSPTATDTNEQVQGSTVPATTYDSSVNNGTQEYDVYAYAYPTQDFTISNMTQAQMQSALKSDVDGVMTNIKGTIIGSSQSSYLGNTSLESSFNAHNTTGYVRAFFINNNEYIVLALGSSNTDFESFANSLQYTGSP